MKVSLFRGYDGDLKSLIFLLPPTALLGFFCSNMQDLTGKASRGARVGLTEVTNKLGRSYLPAEVQHQASTSTQRQRTLDLASPGPPVGRQAGMRKKSR